MTASTVRHRSYSQISQLRRCGWQYKLERIDGVPSRPSAAAVAGVAVHAATEHVDQIIYSNPNATFDDFDPAFQEAQRVLDLEVEQKRQKGWPPETWKTYGRATAAKPHGEDLEWFRFNGVPLSVNAYIDWRLANPEFELADVPDFGPAIEVPFNYYVDGVLIHGWIDRIFTAHGMHVVLDIKSGRKPETNEQLGLYSAALWGAEGVNWKVPYGYYLYGLKTGAAKLTPPIALDRWDDETIGQVYLPATRQIEQGIFVPHPGQNCFTCGVADHCVFSQAVI